jgi:4-hydroxy-tetrahydrodipicolinate synthase
LYDLPQRTQCKIEFETVLRLAKHPNIRGIKCSDEPSYARRIMDELGDSFRVIVAQPFMVDALLKFGMREHLDGIFALTPALAVSIGRQAESGDWKGTADLQKKLTTLLLLCGKYGAIQAFTVLLNARGISGNYVPRPFQPMDAKRRESLLAEPEVMEFLETASS